MPKFDSKSFNPQAFKYSVDHIPNIKKRELVKSKALVADTDIRNAFAGQNGLHYARIAMRGLIEGDAVNYDGKTDIVAHGTKTFERGVVVIGRANAWTERDFSEDVTDGVKFMDSVAKQVSEYWYDVDQDTILAILDGIFAMTAESSGEKSAEFVDLHTYDVSDADDGKITATTLNSAMAQACGDNKKAFSLVLMHSSVSTNLENLNLIKHLTYTDKDGITREIELYSWNGRAVLVDDAAPAIKQGDGSYKYVTYVLGEGAFSYEDVGVKVPVEMERDPARNGGEDTLYTRQRKVFAPKGISYEKKSQASLSPTDAELKNGVNWELVHSGEEEPTERSYINHKAVPIGRIISKG